MDEEVVASGPDKAAEPWREFREALLPVPAPIMGWARARARVPRAIAIGCYEAETLVFIPCHNGAKGALWPGRRPPGLHEDAAQRAWGASFVGPPLARSFHPRSSVLVRVCLWERRDGKFLTEGLGFPSREWAGLPRPGLPTTVPA